MALISLKDLISVSNNGLGLPIDIRQQVDEYINIFDLYQCYPGMRIYVKYDSTSKALTYPKGIYIVKSIYSGTGKPNLVEFIEDYLHISDKVNKPLDKPTLGNFISFDDNGNAVDSNCNTGSFAPMANAMPLPQLGDEGKILGYEAPTEGANPVIGWVDKPVDGDDAYGVYEKEYKEGHEGSTDGMMTRPQWLASLKGEKGDNAVNPFKGIYGINNKPTGTFTIGDYLYAPTSESEGTGNTIWKWNGTTWQDSGETPDMANAETFASSETLQQVAIDDSHLDNPVNTANPNGPVLAQAEDVKEKILDKLVGEIRDFTYNGSEEYLQNVASFIVDKNGVLFALLMNDGSFVPLVKNADQKSIDEFLQKVSSESVYNDPEVLKYLVDENNICFGRILRDGTFVIEKAYIKSLETEEGIQGAVDEKVFSEVVATLSLGSDNIKLSNNPRLWEVFSNMITEKLVYLNKDNENNLNLKPCLSIIDDDTIDNQIPSSTNSSEPTTKSGGYFSVLLPIMLSLSAKYNKKYAVGIACEGHRVGLTNYRSKNDSHLELNENGMAVKWVHDHMGWNVFNHSMTAQLPGSTASGSRVYAYGIETPDTELMNTILQNAVYSGTPYAFTNTRLYIESTDDWYEVRTSGGQKYWYLFNEIEKKKYAQLLYNNYPATSNGWHFNRNFDFDYSWGEWFKRAEELGLPFEKLIVHNGGTTLRYTIAAGRKYAYASIRTTGTYNNPPLQAAINRIDGDPSGDQGDGTGQGYNVFDSAWLTGMKSRIDKCIGNNSWVIIMTHMNDQTYFRNYYVENKSYPQGDPNYPEEWIIPLKHTEIQDLIAGNVDYIENPPVRLGLANVGSNNNNTWDKWHPAPGTHLDALYQLLEYAIEQGVDIVTPWSEYLKRGNILNLGVDTNGQSYSYSVSTPFNVDENSFLTIGVDMSIRYYNSNK